MKPYEQLTERGRVRRLRAVAEVVLREYDIKIRKLSFFAVETNTMFRVDAADGARYMFRIYSPGETTLAHNQMEMFWLDAIARDTDLRVTIPVARRDGEYLSVVEAPGLPEPCRCALFEWVPGKCLHDVLTVRGYFMLGQFQAQLHDHAASLIIPKGLTAKEWDRVFYYPDEPVVYNQPEYAHLFGHGRRELMNRVVGICDEYLGRLHRDKSGRMLIHGDMHYWNVHVHRGDLYVLDFEDTMLGYPIQDIAITLYYSWDHDNDAELCEAFENGYREVRPWPVKSEREIKTLQAARRAMFVNYVARISDSPEKFIAGACEQLRLFLEEWG